MGRLRPPAESGLGAEIPRALNDYSRTRAEASCEDRPMSLHSVGLADEEVRVVEYDAAWSDAFATLAAPLRGHLSRARVEHVGSTSVPGLAAKPIVDISVGLPTGGSLPAALAQRCRLTFRAVNPESVLFAIFERPGYRLANVHVRYIGSESERWDILFRDFLRAHPSVAQRYGEAKHRAADAVEAQGRSRYSETKAPFIISLTEEIEGWALASGWSARGEAGG